MEVNFPNIEEKILKFWKEKKIFEKSIGKGKKRANFVFYEGPPTANSQPGLHHVLTRVYKDIICRYKTMQGFKVQRKGGWDTHGLPVELEIEKKLGLKSKKDIEKYGIAKFNKKCRESVWAYKKDWERLTQRIGFWLDMENPYITYEPDYIETVWWILKQIYQKGLLYQDYKVVPYCPRCGTTLSSHEVALGYKKIKEPALYLKFKILNPEFKNTSLLVWTTTPWTLPGNVAVAINPKFEYVKVKVGDEFLILAKERMKPCLLEGEISQEFKGKDLVNLRYQPLYVVDEKILNIAYKVISGDFVSLEEGTGLVHIAPAFGEEDRIIGKENNLPILLTVDEQGHFKFKIKKWAGLFVKDADPLIIEDLKNRDLLFKQELYQHDYPFCWRCNSPLLYYLRQSWFIKIQEIKKDLIKNNKKINWIPAHLKQGRFGQWIEEIKDWALSRERFWGTPLPIWQCKNCKTQEIIGRLEDLLNQKFNNNNYFIFRHGHSLRQIKKIAVCWPEKTSCPLTKEGKAGVEKTAKKLKREKIDLIFSSDLLRTKQTAKILSQETGAKIIFDKRLREWNVGIFNGKLPHLCWQYLKKKKDWLSAKPPQGESLVRIRKRTYHFLKGINKKYQGKNILIVSHELPLTILKWSLKGWCLGKILEWRRKKKIKKIGLAEFQKIEFKELPFNKKMELDFHRPYMDEVRFYCPKCKGIMERVPEVIDCWFDSGSMPFAQYHYPFENKKLIDNKKQFPADYISEAVDQTRGWFYTLLAISTLLELGPAYKNVISLGHVLDEKGEKMSKSKGNVIDPWDIVGKYGADALRWYFYTANQPGDSKLFSEKEVEESLRKFITTFWNCFKFYHAYSFPFPPLEKLSPKRKNPLDKWIISKLNILILEVTNFLNKYQVTRASRSIENFLINDLSLWYIRRSRPRFQRPETKRKFKNASHTLSYVLLTLNKLTAPFIPFLSEKIYQSVRPDLGKSVHLEKWPKENKTLINRKLERKMEKVKEIVSQALAERAKFKIKVRQPLNELQIKDYKLKKEKELLDLIKDEVNVKGISFGKALKLDIQITPQLKEEGMIREVIRHIQEMRRKTGLKPKHKILIQYFSTPELNKMLEKNKKIILFHTQAKDFSLGKKPLGQEVKIDQQKLWLAVKKI